MHGPALLRRWLKVQKLSVDDFAELVGAHRTQIYRARKGERRPGPNLAAAIEKVTSGRVPASAWADPERLAHLPRLSSRIA